MIVDVEFEGPDPERQPAWADAVFEAPAGEPKPPPGSASARFRLSTGGTRVPGCAEGEGAQAHVDALAGSGNRVGSATAQWELVQNRPALKSSSVNRYDHALGLVPD